VRSRRLPELSVAPNGGYRLGVVLCSSALFRTELCRKRRINSGKVCIVSAEPSDAFLSADDRNRWYCGVVRRGLSASRPVAGRLSRACLVGLLWQAGREFFCAPPHAAGPIDSPCVRSTFTRSVKPFVGAVVMPVALKQRLRRN